MSSDDEEEVKLYSALQRNQKRQIFVTLSSSESEDDDVEFEKRVSFTSPPRKRSRNASGSIDSLASPATTRASTIPTDKSGVVLLDDGDDDDDDDDNLMTSIEKERARQREVEIEADIHRRLAQDTLLNQTRAIINLTASTKQQINATDARRGIISLDSDDDDDAHLVQVVRPKAPPPAPVVPADKGERMTLQVRSNGSKVDEIIMFSREPFSVLYERFCELHGLPRSAVQMSLDGEKLREQDTPQSCDLESGDLIDTKVDFAKADNDKKKTRMRLKLVVDGKKPETFRIDITSTMEKLHSGFCKKHQISDPDDVEMTVNGDRIRMHETIEDHQLYDGDEIHVTVNNYVDPSTIQLNLRYDAKTSRKHSIVPSQKVETLLTQAAQHLGVDSNRITFRLDGEGMLPNHTFEYYDLEGGELIEVKVRA